MEIWKKGFGKKFRSWAVGKGYLLMGEHSNWELGIFNRKLMRVSVGQK